MPVGVSSNLPDEWATVDMVNRFTFCPRLFHLMYVQGRWEDNTHTLEGKDVHRRVDRIEHLLPESKSANGGDEDEPTDSPKAKRAKKGEEPDDADPPPEIARSVSLGCDDLGLMGKLDLVSADPEGGEAVPVETKKSRVPPVPERSYLPERVQLMAQGLLLRAHGYRSGHGYLYFAGSRSRVRVEFTPELEAETRAIISAVREARASVVMPPPLEDSPKCWGCSLCGICLPDETNALRAAAIAEKDEPVSETALDEESGAPEEFGERSEGGPDVRRLYAARDRAMPFYVQEQGARVGKSGERLTVTKLGEKIGSVRLIEVSQAILMMEPFRPIIADSVVITAVNTGMVGPKDFVVNANGCAMLPSGRKGFLRAWEQRLDQLYTHPEFDYRCSWRTILRIQARLLARWLRGDIPNLPWPVVR